MQWVQRGDTTNPIEMILSTTTELNINKNCLPSLTTPDDGIGCLAHVYVKGKNTICFSDIIDKPLSSFVIVH